MCAMSTSPVYQQLDSRMRPAEATRPALTVESVFAGYGKREVLNGISLSIGPGETVAILGANGAGKSTLLKVIMGLVPSSQGKVLLGGREIQTMHAHERRRLGIAYLPQRDEVFPSLTVGENLYLGTWALPKLARKKAVVRILEDFPSLQGHLRRQAGLLSGGQRRMLALAMTMISHPKLLLLDEPSAGLAPSATIDIFEEISVLARKESIPVFWAEQRVTDVLNRADRALMLRRGTVAEETNTPRQWLSVDLWNPLELDGNP
jgi:ABC-type branched-subunit amino acid transport system ATPase component